MLIGSIDPGVPRAVNLSKKWCQSGRHHPREASPGPKIWPRTGKDLWPVDAKTQLPLLRSVPRAFPAQTVRDLIGIARLLYRTWHSANAGDGRLPELVAIGKDLQTSLTIA